MSQKRVIRILSYEGNEKWVDHVLSRNYIKPEGRLFHPGSIKELHSVELKDGETLVDVLIKVGLLIPSAEAVKKLV